MELKSYWNLSEYKLRSVKGIERLINLESLVYAILCLLPWITPTFKSLRNLSVQERRYEVGKAINQDLFFRTIAEELENDGKYKDLATDFSEIARKIHSFAKSVT